MEPTADVEPIAARACPYPDCPGVLAEAAVEELAVCPDCHRIAARCPGQGRRGRCGTLNRPLARYCRQCRQELPPGWAVALWAEDAGGGRRPSAAPFSLEPPLPRRGQPVLCLDGYLRYDDWERRPLGLALAGGWLWVGGADGRCLFVNPFHDRGGPSPVLAEPLWPGAAKVRLRACTSGVWVLLSSEHGAQAVNLLSLDDPEYGDCRPLDLWQAGAEAPVADAVLLRDSPEGLERLAVWLTGGPGGVTLWSVPLLVTNGRLPAVRRYAPETGGGPLRVGEGRRAALVVAPFGDRERLLLATEAGLWLLDPAAGLGAPVGADGRRPLEAMPLLGGRRLLVNAHEAPGVVFVPGGAGASADEAGGTAYAAAAGREREELCGVLVSGRGAVGQFAGHEQGGLPLDNLTLRGRRLLLCRAGRSLLLCDAIGQQTRIATSDALPWTVRAGVHGRVAVCSGRDASEGSGRWFVQLWDLGEENALIDQAVTDALAAHPLLLGRYLFAMEAFRTQGRQTLWLTRRRLESTDH